MAIVTVGLDLAKNVLADLQGACHKGRERGDCLQTRFVHVDHHVKNDRPNPAAQAHASLNKAGGIEQGIREMMVEQKNVFYYVTLMNENYAQPDLAVTARSSRPPTMCAPCRKASGPFCRQTAPT